MKAAEQRLGLGLLQHPYAGQEPLVSIFGDAGLK
jgi:hypothetical protein